MRESDGWRERHRYERQEENDRRRSKSGEQRSSYGRIKTRDKRELLKREKQRRSKMKLCSGGLRSLGQLW